MQEFFGNRCWISVLATWWFEKTVDFSHLRIGTGEAMTVLKINESLGVKGRAGCIAQLEDVNVRLLSAPWFHAGTLVKSRFTTPVVLQN